MQGGDTERHLAPPRGGPVQYSRCMLLKRPRREAKWRKRHGRKASGVIANQQRARSTLLVVKRVKPERRLFQMGDL